MKRHITPRAVNRARWFSELSAALDNGEIVLARLAAEGADADEVERLRRRLIELRAELAWLNRVDLAESRVVGATWPDAQKQAPAP